MAKKAAAAEEVALETAQKKMPSTIVAPRKLNATAPLPILAPEKMKRNTSASLPDLHWTITTASGIPPSALRSASSSPSLTAMVAVPLRAPSHCGGDGTSSSVASSVAVASLPPTLFPGAADSVTATTNNRAAVPPLPVASSASSSLLLSRRSLSEVFPRSRHRRVASAVNEGDVLQPQHLNQSSPSASLLGSPCSSHSLPTHFPPSSAAATILFKAEHISATARFAFSDLVITVLRLDFFRPTDAEAIKFCNRSLDILLKWGELPPKTQQSLRHRIEENQPFNEDIGALITAIKLDPPLRQSHGLLQLLGSLLLSVLSDGDYDSRFRVLLRHISALLGIHWDHFEEFEASLGDRLVDEYNETIDNQRMRENKSRLKKLKRYAMIGAASGLGGVLIGVTGGLAAPVILTSISALTATTILLPAAASVAIFGSLFGAAGAGLTGYRMQKRVGDIEEFRIERLTEQENQGLHCVLCVSGWIEDREEGAFRHHWRHLWMSREQYTLRWESKYLEELGRSIDYFVSFVVSYAIQRSLMETMLASLVSAIAWPLVLLGSSCVIDNPWNICTRRACQVGEHLAEVLLTRQHGRRPITLIGFSLGARVLYHCLLEMSKRLPDSLGIVQDVILLGAPVSASPSQWRQLCSVVAGRVINGYCKTDWLLRFLYRTMSVQFIIAGTGPVDNRTERKIVNFNLSHIVKGHLDYAKKMTQVLEAVGVRCTPLSHASRTNLSSSNNDDDDERQREMERAEIVQGEEKEVKNLQRELDESSTVVEQLKQGLSGFGSTGDENNAKKRGTAIGGRNFIVGSVEEEEAAGSIVWGAEGGRGGGKVEEKEEELTDPLMGVRLMERNCRCRRPPTSSSPPISAADDDGTVTASAPKATDADDDWRRGSGDGGGAVSSVAAPTPAEQAAATSARRRTHSVDSTDTYLSALSSF